MYKIRNRQNELNFPDCFFSIEECLAFLKKKYKTDVTFSNEGNVTFVWLRHPEMIYPNELHDVEIFL